MATSLPKFNAKRKEKLNAFFEKIEENATIDIRNEEIKDIQSAVEEMLERLKDTVNGQGLFEISHIQLCGSMAEHTSLWKTGWNTLTGDRKTIMKYIEFDYVAILERPRNYDLSQGCQGCMVVNKLPWDEDLLLRYGHVAERTQNGNSSKCIDRTEYDRIFKREVSICLSSSCDCYFHLDYPSQKIEIYHSAQQNPECGICTIRRPTGSLRIETLTELQECYLILKWTSNDKGLLAYDEETLERTSQVKSLPVCVDFLPAVEIPKDPKAKQDLLIVPKKCVNCSRDGWRISNSSEEIDFVRYKMSDKHRRCYLVLKFLIRFFHPFMVVNNYHVKTAVLHHSASCSGDSEDCVLCMVAILKDLSRAYDCGILPAFGREANLTGYVHSEHNINVLLTLITSYESWKALRRKNTHKTFPARPRHLSPFESQSNSSKCHTAFLTLPEDFQIT